MVMKQNQIEILARIDERLNKIEEYLEKLNGKLLDHDVRLRDLEKLKWQIVAYASIIPIIISVIAIIIKIFK